jgi:WD40-like Beta Propeller Repeat
VSHRASVNDPWGEAVNLGPGINTSLFEGSIDISPDQRTASFAGVTPDFVFDLFMSTRGSTDESFGPRVKLPPPINSEGHDYGPALTPDGHTMFFSSGADNPFAPGAINHLYVSERRNDRAPWGPRIYLDTINCRPASEGCRPFARAARRFAGWAIAATAFATRTFTARRAAKPIGAEEDLARKSRVGELLAGALRTRHDGSEGRTRRRSIYYS